MLLRWIVGILSLTIAIICIYQAIEIKEKRVEYISGAILMLMTLWSCIIFPTSSSSRRIRRSSSPSSSSTSSSPLPHSKSFSPSQKMCHVPFDTHGPIRFQKAPPAFYK